MPGATTLRLLVNDAGRDPDRTFKARSRDGTFLTLSASDIASLFDAMTDHVAAAMAREAELVGLIDDAEDFAALAAIDIDSGWPGDD